MGPLLHVKFGLNRGSRMDIGALETCMLPPGESRYDDGTYGRTDERTPDIS